MKKRLPVYSIVVLVLVLAASFLIHLRFPGEMTAPRVGVLTLLVMALCSPIFLWKRRGSTPPKDGKSDKP